MVAFEKGGSRLQFVIELNFLLFSLLLASCFDNSLLVDHLRLIIRIILAPLYLLFDELLLAIIQFFVISAALSFDGLVLLEILILFGDLAADDL